MEVNGHFHALADLPWGKEVLANPLIRDSIVPFSVKKSWEREKVITMSYPSH